MYSDHTARLYNHTPEEFAGFFGPLPLVPPGVVDAARWYPGVAEPPSAPGRQGQILVGVGRVSR